MPRMPVGSAVSAVGVGVGAAVLDAHWAGPAAAAGAAGLAALVMLALAAVHTQRHAALRCDRHTRAPLLATACGSLLGASVPAFVALHRYPIVSALLAGALVAFSCIAVSSLDQANREHQADGWNDAEEIIRWRGISWVVGKSEAHKGQRLRRWLSDTSSGDQATTLARAVPRIMFFAAAASVLAAPGTPGQTIDIVELAIRKTTGGAPSVAESGNGRRTATTTPNDHVARPARAATDPATTPVSLSRERSAAEAECVSEEAFGAPAPEPVRLQLRSMIVGSTFFGRDGIGTRVAGCIQSAERVAATGVHVMRGVCGTAIRSLSVASSTERGHVLLQARAEAAYAEAVAGRLRGASARVPVGRGDMQLIDTSAGSQLTVRARSSGGEIAGERPADPTAADVCGTPTDYNVPHTALSETETAAFAYLVALGRQWAWPQRTDDRVVLLTDEDDPRVLASIACSAGGCTTTVDGRRRHFPRGRRIDVCDLARWAPTPPKSQLPDPTDPQPCG